MTGPCFQITERNQMQNGKVRMLIRDDGVLYPWAPKLAAQKNLRPYHGPLDATLEQRKAMLRGDDERPSIGAVARETNAFDISKAGKDELLEFALDEYGQVLDGRKRVEALREDVIALAKKVA